MVRECIEQALFVFESKRTTYRPELMRTTNLLSHLYKAEGAEAEAESCFESASSMYAELKREREEEIPSRDLTSEDFDAAVTFWSR